MGRAKVVRSGDAFLLIFYNITKETAAQMSAELAERRGDD